MWGHRVDWLPCECDGSGAFGAGPTITHERWGSRSDPSINGHLHYPHDLYRSPNEAAADKIRQYRADYNNRPSNAISFMPAIASTSGRVHIVNLCVFYSYQLIGKLTAFLWCQEVTLCNMTVTSSTTAARRSPHSSNRKWATSSPTWRAGLQHCGYLLI